jgi:hypothetical protein
MGEGIPSGSRPEGTSTNLKRVRASIAMLNTARKISCSEPLANPVAPALCAPFGDGARSGALAGAGPDGEAGCVAGAVPGGVVAYRGA